MKAVINSYNKLREARRKYDSAVEKIYSLIRDKVEFNCYVIYQPGDGHVLLSEDDSRNAPLLWCLNVIEEKGKLTYDDYLRLTI